MKVIRKFVCLFIIIFFLITSTNKYVSVSKPIESSTDLCYGFLVPCFRNGNLYIREQINYKIKNLVNDFLREEIPIYWTSINQTILVKKINDTQKPTNLFFERGAFIIIFTGDEKLDSKIVSIVCDYNASSEIDKECFLKIPIYEIMESLDISVYKLSELRIAQYRNLVTNGEMCSLSTASKCGFLNYEFLDHTNLAEKLNNDTFNVLLWPGGDPKYSSFYKSSVFKTFYDDIRFKISRKIRDFVNNGGGFIGSCFGADYAASGVQIGPISIFLKRKAYNPKLNSIGLIAISDVTIKYPITMVHLAKTYSKINDSSHPITYGLDEVVNDFLWGGPEFAYIGKNSQVVANFYDINNPYNGKPSWISSKFGNGKVAIFSGHPEVMGWFENNRTFDGIMVLSNSLFYTTSKGIIQLDTIKTRSISFIENIWNITLNLTDYLQEKIEIFNEIKTKINTTIFEINNLNNYLNFLKELINNIANEKNIDRRNLGYISINESTKYYMHPFVTYLQNTTKVLEILETLYPSLINDTNFTNNIEKIKNDLNLKLKEIDKIITKSFSLSKDCENLLLRYKESDFLQNMQIFLILDKAHKYHWNIFEGFYYIPQTYFNSLKLLRTSWYNFETILAL